MLRMVWTVPSIFTVFPSIPSAVTAARSTVSFSFTPVMNSIIFTYLSNICLFRLKALPGRYQIESCSAGFSAAVRSPGGLLHSRKFLLCKKNPVPEYSYSGTGFHIQQKSRGTTRIEMRPLFRQAHISSFMPVTWTAPYRPTSESAMQIQVRPICSQVFPRWYCSLRSHYHTG